MQCQSQDHPVLRVVWPPAQGGPGPLGAPDVLRAGPPAPPAQRADHGATYRDRGADQGVPGTRTRAAGTLCVAVPAPGKAAHRCSLLMPGYVTSEDDNSPGGRPGQATP